MNVWLIAGVIDAAIQDFIERRQVDPLEQELAAREAVAPLVARSGRNR